MELAATKVAPLKSTKPTFVGWGDQTLGFTGSTNPQEFTGSHFGGLAPHKLMAFIRQFKAYLGL
jgi:hypothetical protein